MSGSGRPDTIKPLIDLIVEQHQNGAPDGVIRLTARSIQGEILREMIDTWKPLIDAAREMRSCFGLTNHSLYLMKSGVDLEKAIAEYDEAVAKAAL